MNLPDVVTRAQQGRPVAGAVSTLHVRPATQKSRIVCYEP
jgi:hypothetical protein